MLVAKRGDEERGQKDLTSVEPRAATGCLGERRDVASDDLFGQMADTDVTVLIQDGSGSGTEVVAHMLHAVFSCAQARFVELASSALPENLLESESQTLDEVLRADRSDRPVARCCA